MAKYKSVAEAVKDIKVTGQIKIVGNSNGHGLPLGTYKVDVGSVATNSAGIYATCLAENGGAYARYTYMLKDIEMHTETKESIQERITELKSTISVYEAKLSYMEEVGTSVYDETEFKVYHTLKLIDTKKSKAEKAKLIAQLIKG